MLKMFLAEISVVQTRQQKQCSKICMRIHEEHFLMILFFSLRYVQLCPLSLQCVVIMHHVFVIWNFFDMFNILSEVIKHR